MTKPGGLLSPTMEERKAFVRKAIEAMERLSRVSTAGTRIIDLLAAYRAELLQLEDETETWN